MMEQIQEPITGNEKYKGKNSPYAALVEFYDAFNHSKMEVMSNNWANTPAIAMDNPLGGIMRGWENISSIYERIFNGQANVYVEFYDYTIHELGDTFHAVGKERGHFEVGKERINLQIRTSRIFQRVQGKWKQVHHHGSIEDPALLKTYQDLVKK